MARAHLRELVQDTAGNAIQNAAVYAYATGTTSAVTGAMHDAASDGNVLTNPLISDSRGAIDAWLDIPQTVDLVVTDNSGACYYPGTPSETLSFADQPPVSVDATELPVLKSTDNADYPFRIQNASGTDLVLFESATDTLQLNLGTKLKVFDGSNNASGTVYGAGANAIVVQGLSTSGDNSTVDLITDDEVRFQVNKGRFELELPDSGSDPRSDDAFHIYSSQIGTANQRRVDITTALRDGVALRVSGAGGSPAATQTQALMEWGLGGFDTTTGYPAWSKLGGIAADGSLDAVDLTIGGDTLTNVLGDALLPWRHEIDVFSPPDAAVGTWQNAAAAVLCLYEGQVYNTAHTVNDYITFNAVLAAGTYDVSVMLRHVNLSAIATIEIDGATIGTADGYAGADTYDHVHTITGVTVATTAKHAITIAADSKNASSSDYYLFIQHIALRRTA